MTRWIPWRILAVAVISIAALIGLVVRENAARAAGREVILSMRAADPRDALTGHYVIVSLSQPLAVGESCPPGLDREDLAANALPSPGDVWIALGPGPGGRHRVLGVAAGREAAEKFRGVVVRGSADCQEPVPAHDDVEGMDGQISLDLGVDRFHIGQAEAERIGAMITGAAEDDTKVAAIISVDADGKARLKGLLVEGRRMMLDLN